MGGKNLEKNLDKSWEKSWRKLGNPDNLMKFAFLKEAVCFV